MKIKQSKFDVFINLVSLIILAGVVICIAANWSSLPDKIPGHYNAMGEVDRWESKGELLFLPIVSWMLYLAITVLEQFPKIWNTGVSVTEENRERVYRILKSMIGTVKLLLVAFFAFLSINSMLAQNLPIWFLPVFLVLIFGTIIFFVAKLMRANKV